MLQNSNNPTTKGIDANTIKSHIEEIKNHSTNHVGIMGIPLDVSTPNYQENLLKYRINPKDDIPPPETAWKQLGGNEAIMGTLGNFSLFVGKAKSRKSFFVNIAVSAVLSTDTILNQFVGALPLEKNKVLYFDTEQGKFHVQLALKRICTQIGIEEPKNLEVYGLRSLTPSERLAHIDYAINNTENLGFVVIDGIKDLITSINDEGEATMIASKLLKWTEEKNIHIVTVLHQNKSDTNARGHIGTELINKAETVLSVTRSEKNKELSIVEPQQCRNREPEPFGFEINSEGLPVSVNNWEERTKKNTTTANVLLDWLPENKVKVLKDAFRYQEEYYYLALVIQLKLSIKKTFQTTVGDNKVKEFVTHCKNENWITQEQRKAPYKLNDIDI